MPKISIIYHLYSNTKNLKKSLNSIMQMEGLDDVELVIIDDHATQEVLDVLNNTKVNTLKNYKLVSCSQNLGHSYSYNLGIKIATANYVFLAGSEVKFKPDFVKSITKCIDQYSQPDMLFFQNNYDRYFTTIPKINLSETQMFTQLDADLVYEIDWTLSNKVFKKNFLIKSKTQLIEFHYYPALFVMSALAKFHKLVYLNKDLVECRNNTVPSYNLYDLIFQIEEFYALAKKYGLNTPEYNSVLEFWSTKISLYDFIYYVINSDLTDREKEIAISAAYKLNTKIYSKFSTNKYIKRIQQEKWRLFFSRFKPKLAWVQKEFNTK